MMAARYWAPRDVRVEQVAEPEPGAGEVVLRVEAALTCGTDAKCYRRGHPVLPWPRVITCGSWPRLQRRRTRVR